jgi:NAD(P)-dependent dehydrogenase (short-subunit alcohol dehydrogenase family)
MASQQPPSDPRSRHPAPSFPSQAQEHPGREADLRPTADHGEASYVGSNRLRDRVAIVTGADSGIGRAVALAFAREGADVVIAYLDEHDDAAETARLVQAAGRTATLVPGDLASEVECQDLIARTVQTYGRIDILVSNAAYQMDHEGILDLPTEDWERTFRTNVHALFWLCRGAIPHMPKGSSIIATASIQGFEPSPRLLAYATTKGAIVTFSQALAQEAITHGIRVNVVAPGPVWTPLIPATMPQEKVAEFGKNYPMGRPAQPAELAGVYVFLASEAASYVTGAVYAVTGGKIAN